MQQQVTTDNSQVSSSPLRANPVPKDNINAGVGLKYSNLMMTSKNEGNGVVNKAQNRVRGDNTNNIQ